MAIMAIVSIILVIVLGALVARAVIKHFFLGLDGEENEEEDIMTMEASDKSLPSSCQCQPGKPCVQGHEKGECDGDGCRCKPTRENGSVKTNQKPVKDPFVEKRFKETI